MMQSIGKKADVMGSAFSVTPILKISGDVAFSHTILIFKTLSQQFDLGLLLAAKSNRPELKIKVHRYWYP